MTKLAVLLLIFTAISTVSTLRCFEGTVKGLESNAQTPKKECGGISNYCIQRIDKKNGEMRRECSSWSDEHSMEEKCPMTGCHFQTKDSTFCCCQFDECNEWKGDGTEFKAGETVVEKAVPSAPKLSDVVMPTAASRKNKSDDIVRIPTTPAPTRKSSLVELP
ncbi:hypothetical protein CAEBREN_18492 [Caenorhabditis brenneri]|uniref:Uncharacterized protein n=2 Tax=Caenorhabditis brenneri TaxID=135651 RepID=G0NYN2_CAEBE|nr:hypothetical protein CAEBREN_18492 [Caenorhabditis brenneri]